MKRAWACMAIVCLLGACVQEQPPPPPPPQGGYYGGPPGYPGAPPPGPGQPIVYQPTPMPPRPHPPVAYGTGVAVHATSPSWMSVSYLGAPLDVNFQPLRGAGAAAPVFSGGALPQQPVRAYENDFYQADKQLEFGANVSTWVVDAGVQFDNNTRFMSQRARYVDFAIELNERSAMNPPPSGSGATWYVGKIYFGATYDEILYEHDTTLTASVEAGFLSWGGDMHLFAQQHRLQDRTIIRGLSPNGQALFARTPADVSRDFTLAPNSSVPIMVEYRSIPNVAPRDGPIPWRP
jgi:hypothetical protein